MGPLPRLARRWRCRLTPPALPELRRIYVVGTSCSGKTTLARSLARALASRHVELDAIHWQPSWQPTPLHEFREKTRAALDTARWVADGNYSGVRDLMLVRATLVIWLNYPFPTVLWRALRRTVTRVVSGEELYSGNHETFRHSFLSRDSILWWVVTSFRHRRRVYRALAAGSDFPRLRWIELTSPEATRRWLGSVVQTE